MKKPEKRLERELRRKAGENEPKYPKTRREYKRWVKELARKYGVPEWQIENTIRELGVEETLRRLEALGPREGGGLFKKLLKKLGRLWRRG